MRTHLDIRFTSPLAALGAAGSPCVSSDVSTRMRGISFRGFGAFNGVPNHPYALARRSMR